jgi:DNA-binding MarR family transcriptional regulator
MEAKQRKRMIEDNLGVAETILQQKLRHPSSIPDEALVIPLSLLAGGKNPLTQSRWQVLLLLREHGAYNRIQDLADALGRGKHRVSKDLDILASLGLVHKKKKGRETSVQPDLRRILLA